MMRNIERYVVMAAADSFINGAQSHPFKNRNMRIVTLVDIL
jgi:hypothetical protein